MVTIHIWTDFRMQNGCSLFEPTIYNDMIPLSSYLSLYADSCFAHDQLNYQSNHRFHCQGHFQRRFFLSMPRCQVPATFQTLYQPIHYNHCFHDFHLFHGKRKGKKVGSGKLTKIHKKYCIDFQTYKIEVIRK